MSRFALLLFVLVAVVRPAAAQDDPATAVLDVLAERVPEISLVAYPVGHPDAGVFVNADVARPLASTIKILVLAEYARQAEAGLVDPDERVLLTALDTYYLEGSDGGAHEAAVAALRSMGRVTNETVALADVAWAMIRFSDNAATDYLIMRFGRDAMAAVPERLGLAYSNPPVPIGGFFLAVTLPMQEGERADLGSAATADRAWRLAERLRDVPAFRNEAPERLLVELMRLGYAGQTSAMLSFQSGTAREYASLMARLHARTLVSEAVSNRMLDVLDWPMEFPGNQEQFDLFATKGGALPGIVTTADLADAKPQAGRDVPPMVVVLFVEGLPQDIWTDWLQTFAHQQFELKLLTDAAFLRTVGRRLRE